MGKKKVKCYILFPSLTEGIKTETLLKKEKIKYTIVPTPSKTSVSCGISIMYSRKDEEKIKRLIEYSNINVLGFYTEDKRR